MTSNNNNLGVGAPHPEAPQSTVFQQQPANLLQQPTTQYFLLQQPPFQSGVTVPPTPLNGGGCQGGLGDGQLTFSTPAVPARPAVLGSKGRRDTGCPEKNEP